MIGRVQYRTLGTFICLWSVFGCSMEVPGPVAFTDDIQVLDYDAFVGDVFIEDTGDDVQFGEESGSDGAASPPCDGVVEQCNDRDDDCDGLVDEDFEELGRACFGGEGVCERPGVLVCAGDVDVGAPLVCDAEPGRAEPELCDGLDNDCDGQVDEGFEVDLLCVIGLGACLREGMTVCREDGAGPRCTAELVAPMEEICDGVDNDCDGETDEDLMRPCFDGGQNLVGVGQCVSGTQSCQAGDWGTCRGQVLPGVESCDGLDEDCDGALDETFERLEGRCEVGVGACRRAGKFICTADATDVRCSAVAEDPEQELCDDVDNDCDGRVDEAFDLVTRCIVGIGECARSAVPVCQNNGQGTRCPVSPGAPVLEGLQDLGDIATCDGYDNDCDGRVDERHYGCCINGVFDAACISGGLPGGG